jgi:hypothetical protein
LTTLVFGTSTSSLAVNEVNVSTTVAPTAAQTGFSSVATAGLSTATPLGVQNISIATSPSTATAVQTSTGSTLQTTTTFTNCSIDGLAQCFALLQSNNRPLWNNSDIALFCKWVYGCVFCVYSRPRHLTIWT